MNDPTPAVKRARLHPAIRVTTDHGQPASGDDYTAFCAECGWTRTGNSRTELADHGTAHADNAHPPLPGLGDVVHYRSYGTPGGEYLPECRAAMITHVGVIGDPPATRDAVSLAVFNPDGVFLKSNIPHDPVHIAGGTWHHRCDPT